MFQLLVTVNLKAPTGSVAISQVVLSFTSVQSANTAYEVLTYKSSAHRTLYNERSVEKLY